MSINIIYMSNTNKTKYQTQPPAIHYDLPFGAKVETKRMVAIQKAISLACSGKGIESEASKNDSKYFQGEPTPTSGSISAQRSTSHLSIRNYIPNNPQH